MVKITLVFASLSCSTQCISKLVSDSVYKEELDLDYDHALQLLLSASDLQIKVQALFLIDNSSLDNFSKSLVKKLKQLELFEIPSYACPLNNEANNSLNWLLEQLPFIKTINVLEYQEAISNSEHIIWI